MSSKIQAIRGMHDILPDQTPRWQALESEVRDLFSAYGYREIRLPVVEKTELFRRSIGDATDIVEKEMYTFDDRSGESLTLRPEGTAGCVRACLEHGLLHNQVHRLWYAGPMFRHERPQKGRYRQFFQVGVETFGMPGPDIDAELLLLTRRLWKRLGVADQVILELNSLGTVEERARYRQRLVAYLRNHADALDEDSRRRLDTNPLRILDSKNPEVQALLADAPLLMDDLGGESRVHFEQLRSLLDDAAVPHRVNPRLVRGLDYYTKTVFEWVTHALGAQGTICAGGRYDGLVEQLGGQPTFASGFALGIERLIALGEAQGAMDAGGPPHVYLIRVGPSAERMGMRLAERLRDELPELKLVLHCGGGSFKNQFKRADKSGAAYALILGEDELERGEVSVKPLRSEDSQRAIAQTQLSNFLKGVLF